jgi:type VII secretion effector (TIGR04197 family)
MEIGINVKEFNGVIDDLEKANEKSIINSDDFSVQYSSEAQCITSYNEALQSLKSAMASYGSSLSSDIAKMRVVRDAIVKLDEEIAKNKK